MRCLGTEDLSHLGRRWCYPNLGMRLQNKMWASWFILQTVQEARRAVEVSVPTWWPRFILRTFCKIALRRNRNLHRKG